MDKDFKPQDYVQPGSTEAEKFKDGAKLIGCKFCGAALMVPAGSDVEDCGRHQGNVTVLKP